MKIEAKRLDTLIRLIANLFIQKAREDKVLDSPKETIIDILNDVLSTDNTLSVTFYEAINLSTDHFDAIMDKVVDIAHGLNPSHDCQNCVLLKVCMPSEEQQEHHLKLAKSVTDLEEGGVEGFVKFLEDMLSPDFKAEVIELPETSQTSKENMDGQLKAAASFLEDLLKGKKR